MAALLRRPGGPAILAVIDIVGGLLLAAFAAGLFRTLGAVSVDSERPLLVALVAGGSLLAAIHFSTAIGLLRVREWARRSQVLLAALKLVLVPFGTIVSILTLWYTCTRRTHVLFREQGRTRLVPADARVLAQHGGAAGAVPVVTGAFAVLGLLFLGLIAAIAVPNLFKAIDHGHQKQAMKDMRRIGRALDAHVIEQGRFPRADSMENLVALLVPTYAKALPLTDGWGTPYDYEPYVDPEIDVAPSAIGWGAPERIASGPRSASAKCRRVRSRSAAATSCSPTSAS